MKISPLKYQARPWSSFDLIVSEVQRIVRANPHVARKYNFPADRPSIENWVDSYNAQICEQNGWLQYIDGGPDFDPPPPPWLARSQAALQYGGKLAAGAKTLLSWLGEGAKPVTQEQSNARSAVCAQCPLNRRVELKDFFAHSASELIRRQIEFSRQSGLLTANDAELGICEACACPMKLKVHVPYKNIIGNLQPAAFAALDSKCWILAEQKNQVMESIPEAK